MPNFKNASGVRYLKALFYETTLMDKATVVYTLKDDNHMGYPSLYRLYMEEDDPTEYRFAVKHLDGYEHFKDLCECKWFKPYISRWRKELELRIRSKALLAVRDIAAKEGKETLQANKFLLSSGWKTQEEKHGRGRPSKEEISNEAIRIAQTERQLDEDFNRMKGLPQ